MNTKFERRALVAFGALALWAALAAGVTAPAFAQEGGAPVPPPPDSSVVPEPPKSEPAPPPAAAAPAAAATAIDTSWLALPALAEIRPASEIEADKKTLEALRASASQRMVNAREAEIRWRSRVELQKDSVDKLKKQIDAAKKEKREADVKLIEGQKKSEEAKRTYFERLRDMYGAEGDYQKAVVDYVDSRRLALAAEGSLAERAAALNGARTTEGLEAEMKAIDLVKDRAAKMSAMADKERNLGDKRKAAYDAWKKLGV